MGILVMGKKLSARSPEELGIFANLACMYFTQGHLNEAEVAFRAVLLRQ